MGHGECICGIGEDASGNLFASSFIQKDKKTLTHRVLALHTMPVKIFGLGILNPGTSAKEKYLSSKWVSAELIWNMMGVGAFSDTNRLLALREERCDR